MKCEKCGHVNSEYSIICENCNAPLNIEENKALQEKYHNKNHHIDIEDIHNNSNEHDFNHTRKQVFKGVIVVLLLFISFVTYLLVSYILDKESKEVLNRYSEYMKNSTVALFYFGNEEEINQLCEEYSKNYGFDYLNIQAKKISKKKKRQIQKELNIYNVYSTLVITQSGVPITSVTDISSKEELQKFLQKEELISSYLGDTTDSLESFKDAFASDSPVLLYFPTSYHEDVKKSSEQLEAIAEQYALSYYEVSGYLLSKRQLLKLMSQLGYSEIQEDLILYIIDGKVVTTVEDTKKGDYFKLLSSYGIIDTSSANYLINISFSKFQEFLKEDKTKYVILIGSNDCVYCDRVKTMLGQIANQHHLVIYYLNATTNIEDVSKLVEELGVETGLSTPFMLIFEKGKVLDYVVGPTTKELYVEKLTEMGVIR